MKPATRPTILVSAVALLAASLTACGNAQVPVKTSGQSTSSSTSAGQRPAGEPSSSTPPATPTGNASSPVAPSATASSTTDSSGTTVPAAIGESETRTVDGQEVSGLPKDFPFPAGAKVELAVADTMVQLSAPSGAEIAAFYRAELPKAGFPISSDGGGDAPVLIFENGSWQGQVSVNADTGALIMWSPGSGTSPSSPTDGASSPTAGGSSTTDGLSPEGLGLPGGEYFLSFPTGTKLTDLSETETSGSFSFANPGPAEVLSFYRDFVAKTTAVTLDSDETQGDVTTMKWHTDEASVVLTVDAGSAKMTVSVP